MQLKKTLLNKVWIVLNKKCFIFLIYKKLEKKTGCCVSYKEENILSDSNLQFLICPFLICGDLLYLHLNFGYSS